MLTSRFNSRRWWPLARLVLFAVAYGVSARLGGLLVLPPEHVSAMWPPSGVALAGLLLTRYRDWPALLLASLLAGTYAFLKEWGKLPDVLGIAGGNLLEAAVGAFLLRRLVRFRPSLDRVRDVLGLMGLAALGSCALGATVGVGLLMTRVPLGPRDFWPTWRVFWVGDAMGVLVVAPLLLTWLTGGTARWTPRRGAELAALLVCLGVATHLVFRTPPPTAPDTVAFHPMTYLAFPFLLWAALRFEARGSSLATAVLSTVALWHTAHGCGPFALAAWHNLSLAYLQSFLAAASMSGLLLASALGERRRAQDEVSHLNQELRDSLRTLATTQAELVRSERMAALGELSATVAHEVRNPLGAISNAVAALRRLAPDMVGPAGTMLDVMDEEVQRLDLIVNDLLDFARPMKPRLQPQPLPPVVEGALSASLRSGPAHITVSHTLDESLPPVAVDPQLLHVALTNLFTNAMQAMPGGGTLTTKLEPDTHAGAPHARLTISDTGHGMAPEVRARIFEPFFTTRASGTGLGLAIVRRIVDSHHGEVSVHSTVGQGTTFTVWLPYAGQVPAPG
ncbi:MASE1 domain-containing protein [Pyxidicoccus sp. MSG2]|uniref:MASE1 domain-containing protein n=1 Tax=Pyxidicoccus sp. MSG2 TaxID=2996790 RepID=UPI002270D8C0|nr:MASE1 domain-containing protein [Pyxidicoccus sp. MSG2]MCY1018444.1 MASE1 domain-containing protein [Pyxidicoccus sp. MSG2]